MSHPQHISLTQIGQPSAPAFPHPLLAPADRPPVRSLYIHVPFCSHKCHYCDFYSFVDTRDQQGAFVDRLLRELEQLAPFAAGAPLRTIFIGGGTPSMLRLDLWEQLLDRLHALFDLSWMAAPPGHIPRAEFTVECNPESSTPDLFALLATRGVNRVSIGAQSFNPRHLRTLERTHNPDNVPRALEAARTAGIPRSSIDLIFAIPGQTLDEWSLDLQTALALGTTHLSCYALTYEANTPMTARLKRGEFSPADEDLEADMFAATVHAARSAGLHRYEVSNFARPGHESLHNLAYWRQEQWLAAGPSASGHAWRGPTMRDGSWRWKNNPRLGDYLAAPADQHPPITDVESPDPARLIRERIMMGLRITEGLDAAQLLADAEAAAPGAADLLRRAAHKFSERGLLRAGDRWQLTDEGFLVCDHVAAELMRLVIDRSNSPAPNLAHTHDRENRPTTRRD